MRAEVAALSQLEAHPRNDMYVEHLAWISVVGPIVQGTAQRRPRLFRWGFSGSDHHRPPERGTSKFGGRHLVVTGELDGLGAAE